MYVLSVQESGAEGSLHVLTMADPKSMFKHEKANSDRKFVSRRLQHKKAFSLETVDHKFQLPKNHFLVS